MQNHYIEYNTNTIPCRLESLKPHYEDDNTKKVLYNMYDRERKYMQTEWESVAKRNGALLLCPICEMRYVTDWDHYIPRSVMPEYSMHLQNLIPTCGDCNRNKKNEWLKDGKRIFFNAYYDETADLKDVLDASLIIKKDLPSISISLKQNTEETPDNIRIAISTIANLKLIKRCWQEKVNCFLRMCVTRCVSSVKVKRKKHEDVVIADIWKEEKEIIEEIIDSSVCHDCIEKLVYQIIVDSDEFESWFVSL